MKNEYEGILAQLTESQISLIVRMVQTGGMIPIDRTPQDVDALVREGLLEYTEPIDHKEDYTGRREVTSHGGGVPRSTELGGEWVKWYLAREAN